jgi:hypothetical protein
MKKAARSTLRNALNNIWMLCWVVSVAGWLGIALALVTK